MQGCIVAVSAVSAAFLGYGFGKKTIGRPELFWRYLIIGCMAAMPLMIGGFTWYDEVFAAFFLIANSPVKLVRFRGLYYSIFTLLILYFMFQSFRGMVNVLEYEGLSQSVRKIRWPVFFVVLLGLYFKANEINIRHLTDKDLVYKVALAGLVLNSVYLVWGIYSLIFGGSEVFTQSAMPSMPRFKGYLPDFFIAIWGATAYVHSLLPVFVLAALKTLKGGSPDRRYVAGSAIAVIAATVFLYSSRSGGLALMLLALVSAPRFGPVRFCKMAALSLLLLFLTSLSASVLVRKTGWNWPALRRNFLTDVRVATGLTPSVVGNVKITMSSGADKQEDAVPDVDRKVWLYAMVPPLSADPAHFLFGYGFRLSGYVVAPHVYALFRSYGVKKNYERDVSTEAITNIAVDTGAIGLALLLACFFLAGAELWRRGGEWRWAALAALGLTFGWLFIINVVDSLVLYLTVMPGGILFQLVKREPEGTREKY